MSIIDELKAERDKLKEIADAIVNWRRELNDAQGVVTDLSNIRNDLEDAFKGTVAPAPKPAASTEAAATTDDAATRQELVQNPETGAWELPKGSTPKEAPPVTEVTGPAESSVPTEEATPVESEPSEEPASDTPTPPVVPPSPASLESAMTTPSPTEPTTTEETSG